MPKIINSSKLAVDSETNFSPLKSSPLRVSTAMSVSLTVLMKRKVKKQAALLILTLWSSPGSTKEAILGECPWLPG